MVSCEHCLAWSGDAEPLCDSCREWARQPDRESGPCLRCGRAWPLKDGQCRFCHLVLNEGVGDSPAVEQLWFGAGLGHGLYTKQPGDYSQGSRKSRALDQPTPAGAVPAPGACLEASPAHPAAHDDTRGRATGR